MPKVHVNPYKVGNRPSFRVGPYDEPPDGPRRRSKKTGKLVPQKKRWPGSGDFYKWWKDQTWIQSQYKGKAQPGMEDDKKEVGIVYAIQPEPQNMHYVKVGMTNNSADRFWKRYNAYYPAGFTVHAIAQYKGMTQNKKDKDAPNEAKLAEAQMHAWLKSQTSKDKKTGKDVWSYIPKAGVNDKGQHMGRSGGLRRTQQWALKGGGEPQPQAAARNHVLAQDEGDQNGAEPQAMQGRPFTEANLRAEYDSKGKGEAGYTGEWFQLARPFSENAKSESGKVVRELFRKQMEGELRPMEGKNPRPTRMCMQEHLLEKDRDEETGDVVRKEVWDTATKQYVTRDKMKECRNLEWMNLTAAEKAERKARGEETRAANKAVAEVAEAVKREKEAAEDAAREARGGKRLSTVQARTRPRVAEPKAKAAVRLAPPKRKEAHPAGAAARDALRPGDTVLTRFDVEGEGVVEYEGEVVGRSDGKNSSTPQGFHHAPRGWFYVYYPEDEESHNQALPANLFNKKRAGGWRRG